MARRLTGGSRLGLDEDIANRFEYHPPEGKHLTAHEQLRAEFKDFARGVAAMLPESRERSLFLTKLEESGFWAHAAIARVEEIPNGSG